MRKSNDGLNSGCGCIWLLVYFIVNLTIGAYCTEYVFEFLGAKMVGHPVDIPLWIAGLVSLVVGPITIPAAIVIYLIMPYIH